MTATPEHHRHKGRSTKLGIWPVLLVMSLCLSVIFLLFNQLVAEQNARGLNTQTELHQTVILLGKLLHIQGQAVWLEWTPIAQVLLLGCALLSTVVMLKRMTIERERLENLITERSQNLATLATHLQHVREEERAFLARELHDELGAFLTAAKFDIARIKAKLEAQQADLALERLTHLNTTLNAGIALKRRMVEDLRPSSLANLGLVATLDILAREFSETSRLKVKTQLEEVQLSSSNALTVYRLVQESLTNIAKHAQAQQILIRLTQTANSASIVVEDDGIGFEADKVRPNSHGLAGMAHRVTSAGGRWRIQRIGTAGGTRVEAELPLL